MENYKLAWLFVKDYILNTVIIAIGQTFGVLAVCSMASYAFIRYNFPFKNVIFIIILSFMMVPGMLTLIPQYQMVMIAFNMKNSYLGVILPAITGAVPMGIFLLKTFFSGLPKDLVRGGGAGRRLEIQTVSYHSPSSVRSHFGYACHYAGVGGLERSAVAAADFAGRSDAHDHCRPGAVHRIVL